MNNNNNTTLYIVVEVWRGFAARVYNFKKYREALECKKRLVENLNLQEDDVQLFKENLNGSFSMVS